MENKVKKATAKTAYGKTLDTPLTYEFKWVAYQTDEELVTAKDELTLEEQRKVRNIERETKARGAALTAALDKAGVVKPTEENDPQVGLRNMFRTLQTAKIPGTNDRKYTDEQAREIASTNLGVEWDE